jgi:hypothetical protein
VKNPDQMADNVKAVGWKPSPSAEKAIEDIFSPTS